jgi:phosphoribosyl 1,2-cyclic phosphodiesterase
VFVAALQSGSNGNCLYVEAGGARLLFDAGISGRQAERRLAALGRDIRRVDALLISHEHADHVRCAGIYQRKFGLPLYATPGTLDAAERGGDLGPLGEVRPFAAGEAIAVGRAAVHTLPTPHDGADGVAFVVDDGRRLGLLTDLGHPFGALDAVVASLDAVVLESNHDADMLAAGPYPQALKGRIRGPGGHLSNLEAAELLARAADGRLRWACLAHLSEQNNDPGVTLATHAGVLGRRLSLHVAGRYAATPLPAV